MTSQSHNVPIIPETQYAVSLNSECPQRAEVVSVSYGAPGPLKLDFCALGGLCTLPQTGSKAPEPQHLKLRIC